MKSWIFSWAEKDMIKFEVQSGNTVVNFYKYWTLTQVLGENGGKLWEIDNSQSFGSALKNCSELEMKMFSDIQQRSGWKEHLKWNTSSIWFEIETDTLLQGNNPWSKLMVGFKYRNQRGAELNWIYIQKGLSKSKLISY